MIVSITEQVYIFYTIIVVGVILGMLYDVFKVLRKVIKHSKVMRDIEDLIFWIFVCVIIFIYVESKNCGQIRGYIILGASLGALLYFLTASKLFIHGATICIKIIVRILTPFFRFAKKNIKKIKKFTENYLH